METQVVRELPPINHPKLILLLGPSGSGKTEIIRRITAEDRRIVPTVVCTDRPGREDDFGRMSITPEEYTKMETNGNFLSQEESHGNRYGILKSSVLEPLRRGEIPIQDYPEDMVGNIRGIMSDLATIYITPPSIGELRKRLEKDGRDVEKLRFGVGKEELLRLARVHFATDNIDEVVINRDIDIAARQTLEAIYERVK